MVEEIVLRCAMAREFLYRPQAANRLMEQYGCAQGIYEEKICEEAFLPHSLKWASQEVEWCSQKGIRLIFYGERDYPVLLTQVPDAPFMLYYKGEADLNNPRTICTATSRCLAGYT